MLFFLLINVKMPTIVGILTFMSRKNFMLNWVEHEKSFITSGPGRCVITYISQCFNYGCFHEIMSVNMEKWNVSYTWLNIGLLVYTIRKLIFYFSYNLIRFMWRANDRLVPRNLVQPPDCSFLVYKIGRYMYNVNCAVEKVQFSSICLSIQISIIWWPV